MDSTPPDRNQLRNFFNTASNNVPPKEGEDTAGSNIYSTPVMKSGAQRQQLDISYRNIDTLTSHRIPPPGSVSGHSLSSVSRVESAYIDDSNSDDEFGGEFSFSDLLKSLGSDRLEHELTNMNDLPPLAVACVYGNGNGSAKTDPESRAACVKKLIDEGADVREKDPVFGRSPLHWACLYADLPVIQMIGEALHRQVPESGKFGNTARSDISADLNLKDVNLRTPLAALVNSRTEPGHAGIVEWLIAQGVDLSGPGSGAKELWFVDYLTVDMARSLLAAGLPVDEPDSFNRTLLCKAAVRGNVALVAFLLEQHANPCSRSILSETILHHSELTVDVAALLVAHGANVNATDYLGMTPLMTACEDKNLPMISFLLRKGATVHAKSHDQMTVLQYAPDAETARYLLENAGLAPSLRLAGD